MLEAGIDFIKVVAVEASRLPNEQGRTPVAHEVLPQKLTCIPVFFNLPTYRPLCPIRRLLDGNGLESLPPGIFDDFGRLMTL